MIPQKKTLTAGLIVGLIILGLLVRLLGIGWGLPFFYHVDEKGFGRFTIGYFKGDLNPHFFQVPSLYTYLTASVWAGYYLGGKIAGRFPDRPAFIKAYHADPTVFVLLGRILSALLGVGTVLLVFAIGRRMYGTRAGALAAFMLVFSLEHVKQSHYFVPDVAMIFFLMLSFLFIWSIYTTGRMGSYILAGLFAGLAYASKYGGHYMALPLLLAHFFRSAEEKESWARSLFSPKLLAALAAFFGGFLAGCPYALLDSHKFIKDFRWQARHLFSVGHYGSSTSEPSWLFYLKYGFRENVGRWAQFLIPGGILFALFKHRKKDILLLSIPVTMFVITGAMKSYATRYLLPLTTFFILLAALFLDKLLDGAAAVLGRIKSGGLAAAATKSVQAALVLVFLLPSVWQVARYDDSITRTDTRTKAKHWVEANIPLHERIATEMYGPPLNPADYKFAYRTALGTITFDWLAQRQAKYVIISDIMDKRFLETPKEFPRESAFYRSLDKQAYLLQTFAPRWDDDLIDLHNPTIKIYRLSLAANPSFPGAFRQFRQSVRISPAASGRWAIRTDVAGAGPIVSDEKAGRAYLRLVTSAGREIWRGTVGEEPLPAGRDFRIAADLSCPAPAEPVSLYIGYESTLSPRLRSEAMTPSLDKEMRLAAPADLEKAGTDGFEARFFYAQSSDERGDRYFQTATVTRGPTGWSMAATVFGGRLRAGTSAVVNPFVRITDEAGGEVSRLTISSGKVGGPDAARKPPATAESRIAALPEHIRIFFGCDAFFDQGIPGSEGASEFEVCPVPRRE